MVSAPLGDDVLGDDPTVQKLEAMAAARMGKEAALLTPSGTMANLAAVLTHCGRGDEVILGDKAHTFIYEAGGISAYGGVHPHTIPNQPDGTLRLDDITAAIRPDNVHFPKTQTHLPGKYAQQMPRRGLETGLSGRCRAFGKKTRTDGAYRRGTDFQCRGRFGL